MDNFRSSSFAFEADYSRHFFSNCRHFFSVSRRLLVNFFFESLESLEALRKWTSSSKANASVLLSSSFYSVWKLLLKVSFFVFSERSEQLRSFMLFCPRAINYKWWWWFFGDLSTVLWKLWLVCLKISKILQPWKASLSLLLLLLFCFTLKMSTVDCTEYGFSSDFPNLEKVKSNFLSSHPTERLSLSKQQSKEKRGTFL